MSSIQETIPTYINVNRNLIIDKHIEKQVEIAEKFFENYDNKNTSNDFINQMLDKYIDFHSMFEGEDDKLKLFTWDSIRKHFANRSVKDISK